MRLAVHRVLPDRYRQVKIKININIKEMELIINENFKKKDGWCHASLCNNNTRTSIESWVFEGMNSVSQFEEMVKAISENKTINSLELCCHTIQPLYANYFENVKEISIVYCKVKLDLNSFSNLSQLNSLRINQHSKHCDFIGINHFVNLIELIVGDFSPNISIPITTLDGVIKCAKLRVLMLGNVKIESSEIRKLTNLKSLQELALAQIIDVEDLAYLSAKMPQVKSNELQAWKDYSREPDMIKINGKKRPYLNKNNDQLKIIKYEKEFKNLKEKYL